MKKNYDQLLVNCAYDPNREPPPDQIVIRIEGKNIGSLQNFITITGLPKNGKGKYLAAIMAGAITREQIFGISTRLPEHKQAVALFDTEQSDYDFYKYMENIRDLAGISALPSNFHAFNVREYDPADILPLIDNYLNKNKNCGLLCIDGILDLLSSYNDEGESKRLINILKRWTKVHELLAPIVLHRGKTTSSTLGHLGGMADRASQSILIVEKQKDKSTFQLRADFLRSADDFTPIEIYYNKDAAAWQETTYTPAEDSKVKKIKLRPGELDRTIHTTNVMRIFNASDILQYDALVQGIKEMYAAGTDWARQCVPVLMKENLIFKQEFGFTNNNKARLFITTK
jgi:hypothetical protein